MSVPATAVPDNVTRLPSAAVAPPRDMLAEAQRYGEICARSGAFAERNATTEYFALKILLGAEMGLSPMQSVVYLRFERGRPTLDATLIRARLRACGYEYEFLETSAERAVMRVSKGGRVLTPDVEFSKEDAKTAGLLGKDTYQHYLTDMLVARVSSRAARRHAPDAFGGAIYVPGEIAPDAGGAEDGGVGAGALARAAAALASASTLPSQQAPRAVVRTSSWNLDPETQRKYVEAREMAVRLGVPSEELGAQLRRLSGPDAQAPTAAAIERIHRFLAGKLQGTPPQPVASSPKESAAKGETAAAIVPAHEGETTHATAAVGNQDTVETALSTTQTRAEQSPPPQAPRANVGTGAHVEMDEINAALLDAARTDPTPSAPTSSGDTAVRGATIDDLRRLGRDLGLGPEDVGRRLRVLSGPEASEPTRTAIAALYEELSSAIAAQKKNGAPSTEAPAGEPIPTPRRRGGR